MTPAVLLHLVTYLAVAVFVIAVAVRAIFLARVFERRGDLEVAQRWYRVACKCESLADIPAGSVYSLDQRGTDGVDAVSDSLPA